MLLHYGGGISSFTTSCANLQEAGHSVVIAERAQADDGEGAYGISDLVLPDAKCNQLFTNRASRINFSSFPKSLEPTLPSRLNVSTRCTMTRSHWGMTSTLCPR